ncbi:aspartic proteinase Asp1-like isoform X1 [Olea europaea var. sylvestris]|uniref:aspartic proteinase Asp1-like isoform X1 n=2 Tax=Olea europaea var. sylvestris TaxID=158386 RepID=UPI000C1CDD23|nr:aspartic proteinase Asp1-like isoform X1 [Olea europaea var. sylvestris]
MGKVKQILIMIFILLAVSGASSVDQLHKWRKSMSSGASSSSGVSRVGSSVIFQLYGNVYPNGFYFVQVFVGHPPRPYFLDPDTGSDLTWLQCDAPCVRCTKGFHPLYRPTNDLVVCRDPLCASLHSSDYRCDDNPEQCDYMVEYADGGSSLGVLVNDLFTLNLTSGVRIFPRLTLGCGYDQLPGVSDHPLDGVLGLGKGKSSIVSQLSDQRVVKNVVGQCLSGKGGYLFLGEDVYDSSRITWTPMSRDHTKHYAAGSAEFFFDGKSTGIKNLNVIFDSGSSYTYFNSQIYHSLISSIKKGLSRKLREATDDRTLPFCWKREKPFESIRDVNKYFKPLALRFPNGRKAKPQFEIPPEAYLIISSKGNACLGILNGTDIGLDNLNMIGDISMQNKMLIYDNEKQAIGWTAANCDQPPSSNRATL